MSRLDEMDKLREKLGSNVVSDWRRHLLSTTVRLYKRNGSVGYSCSSGPSVENKVEYYDLDNMEDLSSLSQDAIYSVLTGAMSGGDIEVIKRIFDIFKNRTPQEYLGLALEEGFYATAKFFVEEGAEVSKLKEGVVHNAILGGSFESIKLLHENGYNFDNIGDLTRLAFRCGQTDIAIYLLQRVAGIQEPWDIFVNGDYAKFEYMKEQLQLSTELNDYLQVAIAHYKNGNNTDIISELIALGADINQYDGVVFYVATKLGDVSWFAYLLDLGMNAKHLLDLDPNGFTTVKDKCYIYATKNNNLSIIKLLEDLNIPAGSKGIVACDAVGNDNLEILQYLLEKKICYYSSEKEFFNPLMQCICSNRVEAARMLIEYGYKIPARLTPVVDACLQHYSNDEMKVVVENCGDSIVDVSPECFQ